MNDLILLYAEDDEESRENYAFVLEEYFSKVYTAADGREALELYYDKKPDVLLLDINMPFINGLDVAKTVRKENSKIPIIMLTAYSDKEKLFKAIPLGLSEYIVKPINDKDLQEVILNVIDQISNKTIVPLSENLQWNKINSNLLYKDKVIKLSKKEREFMKILINAIGEYFIHSELIMQIWNDEIPDDSHENKLHQLVYRLNRKINEVINSNKPLIENSYTLGYRVNNNFLSKC